MVLHFDMNDFYHGLIIQVHNIPIFWFIIILFFLLMALIWLSFSLLKDLKKIVNIFRIPVSSIISSKEGYIELHGKVSNIIEILDSPLTKSKCCWYKYKVEKELIIQDSDGNETYDWELVDEGHSDNLLLINDGTGECLVDVSYALVEPIKHKIWIGHGIQNLNPENSSLKINNLFQKIPSFDNTRYKYTEHLIEPDEIIYALGFLKTIDKSFICIDKLINTELAFYFNIKKDVNKIKYLSHKKNFCIISMQSHKKQIKKILIGLFLSSLGAIFSFIFLFIFIYLRVIN